MFDSIPTDINITPLTLLYGDINMGCEQNIAVFKAVQFYMKKYCISNKNKNAKLKGRQISPNLKTPK